MTSVQGGKILADVRTDSFHSGPLCPGNQHTSDRQPAQHVQMATTTPRQSLRRLEPKGLELKCSQCKFRRTESLLSFEEPQTQDMCMDIHTDLVWGTWCACIYLVIGLYSPINVEFDGVAHKLLFKFFQHHLPNFLQVTLAYYFWIVTSLLGI